MQNGYSGNNSGWLWRSGILCFGLFPITANFGPLWRSQNTGFASGLRRYVHRLNSRRRVLPDGRSNPDLRRDGDSIHQAGHTTTETFWGEVIPSTVGLWVLEQTNLLPRTLDSLAMFQRYIAAYARHGRQASARRSSSLELTTPEVRRSPRSPDGKASGSPSARMATYCAVHFPMPEMLRS